MNRNGNSTNFFSYVCESKKNEELFASTLSGINASVRLTRLIAARANKKDSEKQKIRRECRFLLIGTHKHLTFMAVFTMHAKTSLLYIFQRSMQANKNINLW